MILHALSLFQKQRRLRQTSNKSYRIQNLLNWDYWEVNFRCNIHRHRFLAKVVAGKIIKIKLREFLAGNVWTQIKHGGQRPVYTLLITMVKWVAKRTIESRLPGARKREMNGMFSWCYRRWMLSFPASFPCVTQSRERIQERDIREFKNHDDGLVDDDRKWVTLYCASATSKFRRRGVVDDAKQSRITSSCNPQASAGINPLF